ncbi:hypothetical protein ACLEPN_02810 [Myxococcus sp. 1LA]
MTVANPLTGFNVSCTLAGSKYGVGAESNENNNVGDFELEVTPMRRAHPLRGVGRSPA